MATGFSILALALLVATAPCAAQDSYGQSGQTAGSSVGGTAGISNGPRRTSDLNMHRATPQDSQLAGGGVPALPDYSGDTCTLFPETPGCGGSTPPPSGGGGGGGSPPSTPLSGIGTQYSVIRSGSHDVAAGLTLKILADGTWRITGSPGSVHGDGPNSGTWLTGAPAPDIGVGYQVRNSTSSGTWYALNAGESMTVCGASAFATTGSGGPADSNEQVSCVVSIRDAAVTMQIDFVVELTAGASVL